MMIIPPSLQVTQKIKKDNMCNILGTYKASININTLYYYSLSKIGLKKITDFFFYKINTYNIKVHFR